MPQRTGHSVDSNSRRLLVLMMQALLLGCLFTLVIAYLRRAHGSGAALLMYLLSALTLVSVARTFVRGYRWGFTTSGRSTPNC
jgi:hypothetical protein